MPSVTEGLGTSLLDAMACSKPIVASRVGGIPEVVVDGKTGLLVPPKDAERLADAIVKMMKDRAFAVSMGNAGYARVTERFTVERMVEETLAIYERLDGSARAADRRSRAADA
jgi:glycosyltransferase involved in cell wall biosynthesis